MAAVWVGQAGAALAPANLVRNVEIAEQAGTTTVTIEGSSRPSFTAFKLASPRRLIIDIASSEIRGVPSVLDKSTALIGGVAVSQYSSSSGPVGRIVINLKQDAGYRIRAVGSSLGKMHDEARTELLQLKARSEQRAEEASAARLEAQQSLSSVKGEAQ
ncbi:MAG: AMIN domain-containing protein [Myxococcota bacterium]|nr:AMIN domain-containing protein [Myxococcota bacterium]